MLSKIYNAIKEFFEWIGACLNSAYAAAIAFISFLGVLWDTIAGWVSGLWDALKALWQALQDGKNSYGAVVAAGWPPWVVEGLSWVNAYVDLQLLFGCCVWLLALWIASAAIRIIKSFVPTLGT